MSQTLTLRELTEEARALDLLVDMDYGEWLPEHEALAQELAGKLALKGDGYGDYVYDQTMRIAMLHVEEKRLSARRKALEAGVDRLKRYAALALEAMGRDKIVGDRFTVSLAKNPARVVVHDDVVPSLLPPEYVRTIPAKCEPDLAAIKDALKIGVVLDWAHLESSYSVRVR
jgi:hypothetical protein